LIGALLVGVCYAKSLAFARGIPVIPIHHMEGHIFATSLDDRDATPPFTCLLVSGGHTMLLDVEDWGRYRLLGATRDDAAGEAFDKVAKLLGLPYPGGRPLEMLAREGDPTKYKFSKPMVRRTDSPDDRDYYEFSFSGLKTAVLNAVKAGDESSRAHIARGFQDALIGSLVEKTFRAAMNFNRRKIVLGGGVACNSALVAAMRDRVAELDAKVYAPSPRLATDNAAMIARAAFYHYTQGDLASLDLNAYASRPLPGLIAA
jgi:N6-L-threonylcarbamoyladenine synthase